jgi:hypothetical protein
MIEKIKKSLVLLKIYEMKTLALQNNKKEKEDSKVRNDGRSSTQDPKDIQG